MESVVVEKKEGESVDDSSIGAAADKDVITIAEDRERQARDLKAGLHPLKHKFVLWYTRRTPGLRTQSSYEDNIKKIVDFSTAEAFWICYCHLARVSSLPTPTDLHIFKEGIRPLWEDSANCNGGKWIVRFKKAVSGRFWEDLAINPTSSIPVEQTIRVYGKRLEIVMLQICCQVTLNPGAAEKWLNSEHAFQRSSISSKIESLWFTFCDGDSDTFSHFLDTIPRLGAGGFTLQVLALVGDQLEYGENVCGAVLSVRHSEDILSVWNRNASDHQAVMALRDSIKRHLKLPNGYVMEYKPHDASLRDNSSYRNTWLRG